MTGHRLIGIAGGKNAGKTTLVERLVCELAGRGLIVSTVKHAHHTVDVDQPGRDSHRHRMAGAREVALITPKRWAIMHELRGAPEPEIADLLSKLAPADVVVVEGFKQTDFPKIEVRRANTTSTPLGADIPGIVAIVSDYPIADATVPVLLLDDVPAIADFVIAYHGLLADA